MNGKKTVTSIFMMPTLNIPRKNLYKNGYINAYVEDIHKDLPYDEDVIYLLFKPKNL